MSSRKPHQIRIVLDIHAVTCPGVWLCQSGNVELSFSALDYHFRSKPHPPRFPLFMHETFKMEGNYSEPAASVIALERLMANESIEFALWQNGRRLAYYTGRMGVLLDRAVPGQQTTHSTETDLIMKPSSCFPGMISPKIELLASIDIIDTCRSCKSHVFRTLRRPISRQSDDSKSEKVNSLDIRRLHQRPVCHSRSTSRNPIYWKTYFEPALHLDDHAYTARFCDKCVERLSPPMEISAQNLQHPEDNVNRSDYSSPSLGYRDSPISSVNFDCGHSMQAANNTIHPKSCEICLNYRTYFKVMSTEYQ